MDTPTQLNHYLTGVPVMMIECTDTKWSNDFKMTNLT